MLDIANIVERSYDPAKPSRVCAADLTLNTGQEHRGYEMHLNSDRNNYILQLIDDPGPSAQPATPAPGGGPASTDPASSTPATDAAAAPPAADGGVSPAYLVNDTWLTGRWYEVSRSKTDCQAEEGAEGYLVYGPGHRFEATEIAGLWRLAGTTLRTSGQGEGEPFSQSVTITRADHNTFDTRDSQGATASYRRCPDLEDQP